MTVRSIAIFFLVLGTKLLTESIGINNYFRLINNVHRHYRTSSIIFVRSGNYDLSTTMLAHTWLRELSRQRVMTATITFLDLMSEYNEYCENVTRPLFVVLLDTEETMGEFVKTTRSIKPISFPIWLVVFLQRPGNPLENYCRHPTYNIFNVDFSTQMLVLCYARPILVEWYAVRDNRTRTFDLAQWTPDKGLRLRTRKSLYARRSNMFGDVVRVTSVANSPLISLKNGTIGGFLGLLLAELSEVMNFSVKVLDPVEEFGSWDCRKKKWTGAIGQLVANKADIGVSTFTITTHRQKFIDFTMPLIRSRYQLYFKHPDISSVQWFLYFRVFSPESWISLVMVIIIASILLTIMKTKSCFSISLMSNNYFKVWGIYCQQGLSDIPNDSPMRLAFLSIYASSIIIMASYSAALINFLQVLASPKLPFSTLEGYIKDGSYKLIALKNSVYDIPRAKDPVLLQMYELQEKENYLPETLPEGFEQLCKREKVAFYIPEVLKEAMTIYIRCKVINIDTGRIDNMAIALTKKNPYTDFMNYHLRRFQLNGIMSKLKNKYLIKSKPSKEFVGYIDLSDVTPSLTMVAGSMILALLILIIEKVYYSRSKSRSNNKNNELSIKTLNYNLGVRNELRKGNKRNLN